MLLPDVWMLQEFFAEHPPTDLLVAGYFGFKAPRSEGNRVERPKNYQEAAKANGQVNLPGKVVTIDRMPEFIRTGAQKLAAEMKKWQTS